MENLSPELTALAYRPGLHAPVGKFAICPADLVAAPG